MNFYCQLINIALNDMVPSLRVASLNIAPLMHWFRYNLFTAPPWCRVRGQLFITTTLNRIDDCSALADDDFGPICRWASGLMHCGLDERVFTTLLSAPANAAFHIQRSWLHSYDYWQLEDGSCISRQRSGYGDRCAPRIGSPALAATSARWYSRDSSSANTNDKMHLQTNLSNRHCQSHGGIWLRLKLYNLKPSSCFHESPLFYAALPYWLRRDVWCGRLRYHGINIGF